MAKKSAKTKAKASKDEKPKQILSRYTRLEALFEMLELGGIPLYGTERWDDECDKAFVRRGCEDAGTDQCGILCLVGMEEEDVSKAIENSREYVWSRETYGHWKIYTPSSAVASPLEFGIRIDFDKKVLDGLIKKMTRKKVCCRLREMHYCDYGEYLKEAQSSGSDWFFLKRDAYKWEMERRLVVIGQNRIPPRARDKGVRGFVEIDGDDWYNMKYRRRLIKDIVFSPFCHLQGSPTHLDTAQIRFYAIRALDQYSAGKKAWPREKVKVVRSFLDSCSRSGILDNPNVLDAVNAASSPKTGIVPHGRCAKCNGSECCALKNRCL